ncbi:glycosyltransferase family 2 protein [Silvanigrella aquatica]|uniref:Glycosyltransferase 2-like domain-containing protein n=1 Tax=Silvanigrella aquatica TaxID=1915309 RepID=A0A1L4D314_9BACT|nr:glycosyltransferase family 2 protein [Silvanigrella aquatica]APJ04593.1 hypothetical protein AXG55_12025 [Silvanigrella aquatica]
MYSLENNKVNPVVTVIIPTYNHAEKLNLAIKSLIKQTFTAWKVIVVNNYSTDNTVDIVNSFSDKRIQLFNFSNNGIIAASRNYAMKLADTEFIAFLDSDDIWYENKLELCIVSLNKGFDLVCHGEAIVKDGTKINDRLYGPLKNASFENLIFKGSALSPSAVVMRLCFAQKIGFMSEDSSIITAEDYDFWINLTKNRDIKMKFINDILGEYHLYENNASSAIEKHNNAVINVVNNHYFSEIDKNLYNLYRYKKRISIVFYIKSRQYFEKKNYRSGFKNLFNLILTFPDIIRVFILILFLFRVLFGDFRKLKK